LDKIPEALPEGPGGILTEKRKLATVKVYQSENERINVKNGPWHNGRNDWKNHE